MLRKGQYRLLLIILFLFTFLSFYSFICTKSFRTNNKTIENLPSTNSINKFEWNRTWGGSEHDRGHDIAVDNSGNIFITGDTQSFGVGGYDLILLKYNSSGTLLWNITWGGSEHEGGNGLAIDDMGNAFITGSTGSFEEGQDVFLLKYDSSGNLLWNKTWGGSDEGYGYGISVDDSGNVFIIGETRSFGAGVYDVLLLKYRDDPGNSSILLILIVIISIILSGSVISVIALVIIIRKGRKNLNINY